MMNRLEKEMRRYNVSCWDIVDLLGCSEKTLRNKLTGTTGFTYKEVQLIRNAFFPGMTLEYLFDDFVSPTGGKKTA